MWCDPSATGCRARPFGPGQRNARRGPICVILLETLPVMRTPCLSLLIIAAWLSSPAMAVAPPDRALSGRLPTHVSPGRVYLAQSTGPRGTAGTPAPQAASPAASPATSPAALSGPQEAPPSPRTEPRPEARNGARAPVNDAYVPPASNGAGSGSGNATGNATGNSAPAPRPAPASQAGNTYGGSSTQPWSQPARPVTTVPAATGSMDAREPSLPRPPGSVNRWDSSGPSGPPARGPAPKSDP